jgi:mannose-1-phosphate guanylyltransferase
MKGRVIIKQINQKDHFYAIIMAGGGGTRLWPLSRQKKPKQMLKLIGENTLFQDTINRLRGFFPFKKVRVITTREQYQELKSEIPELKKRNFILEPEPKGTASVVGIAAIFAYSEDPEAILAILPADHYIGNVNSFHRLMSDAYVAASKDFLVTISIEPKFPATGYGYIHRGEKLMDLGQAPLYRVQEFREKPDRATALAYCESGDYGWNAGIFIWKAETILEEIQKYLPELFSHLELIRKNWGQGKKFEIDQTIWHEIESLTIDYGIMEKSSRVVTIPAKNLEWSDIGDWDSLSEILSRDEHGNILRGCDFVVNDAKNIIAYSDNPDKLISVQSVSDLIIIQTNDALLICDRKDNQKVKEIVANLRKQGKEKFL